MTRLVREAATVFEAKRVIAKELGMAEDRISFTILEEPRRGLLGLGSRLAKVQGEGTPDRVDFVKHFLKGLWETMGSEATVAVLRREDRLHVDVDGDVIWLHANGGSPLDSLQYLTNVASARAERRGKIVGDERVVLDAGGYRLRREEELQRMARQAAERARLTGHPVIMEAMSAHERRIVHLALEGELGIETRSRGDEPHRQVVVLPKD